ncbi:MAG: hypothetical protein AAGI07_17685 [Bacteroidota bacterium]
MKYLSVSEIHFYNKIWLNRILLFHREIDMYVENISDIVDKREVNNHLRDLIATESILILQKEELAHLKKYINHLEHKLDDFSTYHLFADTHEYIESFISLKMKFDIFQANYAELILKLDKILFHYISLQEV